jgi:hypothetical protein
MGAPRSWPSRSRPARAAAQLQNARAYAQTLTERLDRRLRQLTEERDIQALPPLVKGAALVVPVGLLRREGAAVPEGLTEDALARVQTR